MAVLKITDPLISRILAFVAEAGGPAWTVGGFVRDQLLGRAVHDLDLIVPAGGIELARTIARSFDGAFFILDPERDVARTIIPREGQEPLDVDVARLRTPELADDLALRDFTINAMAAPVQNGAEQAEIVDLFCGEADLASRVLRVVGPNAFRDDPLRTLRAVRLAVELGFHVEPGTANLVRRDAHLVSDVAAERVRDELVRILAAPGAWRHLCLLAELDLLRPALPEVQALTGVSQSQPHYLDVFDHSRSVVAHAEGLMALLWPGGPYRLPEESESDGDGASSDPIVFAPGWVWDMAAAALAPYAGDLRAHLMQALGSGRSRRDLFPWAALAHDWGKPATRTVGADWRVHFYDHEHHGAVLAENRMRLLAFSANEAAYVGQLVDWHMRPAQLARHYPPSSRALYRFYRDAGAAVPDVVLLAMADKLATRGPRADADRGLLRDLFGVAGLAFQAFFRERDSRVDPVPLLNGRQVMEELGLAPGPEIGRVLEALREAQAVGEVATVEAARAWLHEYRVAEHG